MAIVKSLMPLNAAGPVVLTVTTGNAARSGVAVAIADDPKDLEGGDPVEGVGDESSKTFARTIPRGIHTAYRWSQALVPCSRFAIRYRVTPLGDLND